MQYSRYFMMIGLVSFGWPRISMIIICGHRKSPFIANNQAAIDQSANRPIDHFTIWLVEQLNSHYKTNCEIDTYPVTQASSFFHFSLFITFEIISPVSVFSIAIKWIFRWTMTKHTHKHTHTHVIFMNNRKNHRSYKIDNIGGRQFKLSRATCSRSVFKSDHYLNDCKLSGPTN